MLYKSQVTSNQSPVKDFRNLEFTHFVVASFERVVFAAARDGQKLRNFIFDVEGRWAKCQVDGHFEYLPSELAWEVTKIAQGYYTKVPVYRTKTLSFD